MMKLLYSAGACSTSCHIALQESGLKFQAVEVDWDNPSDPNVKEAARINPMGTLPILIADNGKTLDQNTSILTYVADQVPDRKLLPPLGTFERAEAMNWLSFVASDLHKAYWPLFSVDSFSNDEKIKGIFRDWAMKNLNLCLSYLDQKLAGKDYLMGKAFTVADPYCFVVASWSKHLNISMDPFKNVGAYLGRVYQRPSVQAVLKEEGLLE